MLIGSFAHITKNTRKVLATKTHEKKDLLRLRSNRASLCHNHGGNTNQISRMYKITSNIWYIVKNFSLLMNFIPPFSCIPCKRQNVLDIYSCPSEILLSLQCYRKATKRSSLKLVPVSSSEILNTGRMGSEASHNIA